VHSKTVFLDIDGTYVNDRGLIPPSARRAVVQARANGHLVFLATGRSNAMIPGQITEVGFDGLVASAGGYVELRGQVLQELHVPVADLRHAVEFFDAHDVAFLLESTNGLYGSRDAKPRLSRRLFGDAAADPHTLEEVHAGPHEFVDKLVVDTDLIRPDINRLSFFDSTLTVEEVKKEFVGRFDVIPSSVQRFGDNSGEMSIPGVNKAFGIEVLLAHLGASRRDTVAFGDSFNDLEMLQYVQTGVAMGGADPSVRAVADAVTSEPDDDGIANGFRMTGLI
jgi:Cof subfamily protein (haloacid dehalogenase superfamily)